MRTLLVVVALMLCACGGGSTSPTPLKFTAKITNDYAESLFRLTLVDGELADGGLTGRVLFANTRIAAGRSAEAPFEAQAGDQLRFELVSTSLGDEFRFEIRPSAATASRQTLSIVYDYDLALARFRTSSGWER